MNAQASRAMQKIKAALKKVHAKQIILVVVLLAVAGGLAVFLLSSSESEPTAQERQDAAVEELVALGNEVLVDYAAPGIDEAIAAYDTPSDQFANLTDYAAAKRAVGVFDEAIDYYVAASNIEGIEDDLKYYSLYFAYITAEQYGDERLEDLRQQIPDDQFERLATPVDDEGEGDE